MWSLSPYKLALEFPQLPNKSLDWQQRPCLAPEIQDQGNQVQSTECKNIKKKNIYCPLWRIPLFWMLPRLNYLNTKRGKGWMTRRLVLQLQSMRCQRGSCGPGYRKLHGCLFSKNTKKNRHQTWSRLGERFFQGGSDITPAVWLWRATAKACKASPSSVHSCWSPATQNGTFAPAWSSSWRGSGPT